MIFHTDRNESIARRDRNDFCKIFFVEQTSCTNASIGRVSSETWIVWRKIRRECWKLCQSPNSRHYKIRRTLRPLARTTTDVPRAEHMVSQNVRHARRILFTFRSAPRMRYFCVSSVIPSRRNRLFYLLRK